MDPGSAIIAIVAMIVGGIVVLGLIIALIVWMGLSHTRKLATIKANKELQIAVEQQQTLREEIAELRDRMNQQILSEERDVQRRLNA